MCSTKGQFKDTEDCGAPCLNPRIGDSDNSEFLTKQELLSVVAKLLKSKDYLVDKYQFKPINTPNVIHDEDQFFKLEITVTSSRSQKKDYQFFMKKLPREAANCHQKAIKTRAFYKEVELYSNLFRDFEKVNDNTSQIRRWNALCYFTKPGQLIILEDLSQKGFFQVDRRACLDREQVLSVMRSLAALHTASIKFEVKINEGKLEPKVSNFERKGTNLTIADVYTHLNFETDAVRLKCHPGNIILEAGIKSQLNFVDQLPGYSPSEMDEIKRQLPDLLRKTADWAKPSTKYRNVFIHGDLCTNNIFFRKMENGGFESLLVDFQMVRYAPPAMDLMMLLYLTQRRAFRMKEMQTMIQTYYNMFSEELAKNNICIQDVLPVKEFLDSCEEYQEWATLNTVLYFQTYLLSEEVMKKHLSDPDSYTRNMTVDRSKIITECYAKDEVYHIRMTEAMNDLIKTCVKL